MGDFFPDTDPAYEDFPGVGFLERVVAMVRDGGYEIENVDCVVSSDAVRLGGRKKKMAAAIAAGLRVTPDRVTVKATTHEGFGAVGRGEIIACQAVAMVKRV
jgi:2-C-methyl-D-erythritol 2,4-cyclodiphosphate synthase